MYLIYLKQEAALDIYWAKCNFRGEYYLEPSIVMVLTMDHWTGYLRFAAAVNNILSIRLRTLSVI